MKVESMNPRPEVFVANIGNTIKNKPRVDFAIGFFEPAGFICNTNDGFDTVEDALEFCQKSEAKIIVLSSTDDMYPDVVPKFAKVLKTPQPPFKKEGKVLVLAGYPKDHIETFTQAGVDFYVYMRANIVATIKDILTKIGV